MSKQDRQGARTAADIESRYNFRKSFSKVMGIAEQAVETAEKASSNLDEKLTSEEIFNRLTNNGQLQGLYRGDDGELYVNATYIKSGTLSADLIDGSKLTIKEGSTIAGWDIDENSIYKGTNFGTSTFMCTGSLGAYSIGGSGSLSGWVFGAGGKFGVTKQGAVWCSDIHATGGDVGGWQISEHGLSSGKWQSEGNITETYDIIAISKDFVQRVDFDAHNGVVTYNRAEWDWIIGAAREWAEANGLT